MYWWFVFFLIIPSAQHNKVVGGILVSLCPSVPHPVSALLPLQFWLDPFHIYTSYQATSHATSEGVSCVKLRAKFEFLAIFQNYNFDFVLFWRGIWCESLVWVVMGQRGVSQNTGVLVVLVYSIINFNPILILGDKIIWMIGRDMRITTSISYEWFMLQYFH